MLYATLKLFHLLAIIVWLGGMVFAHFFLRPAAQALQPAQRIPLMHAVLQRFFSAVLVAVVAVLATGGWMMGRIAREAGQADNHLAMPLSWIFMATAGLVMVAIFGYIRLALFKQLQCAVATADWPAGGKALATIRTWVGVNLGIGVVIVAVTLLV